jgi:glycosyltransferase involved in cell wall biosynthesis
MKIAFLCGSCEPGADGVGDYTLSLAQALVGRGHTCCVIALNDRYVDQPHHSWIESNPECSLPCLRLPASSTWRARAKILAAELKRFRPDWISLQYVPYAFNKKGLPWRLFACLRAVRPLAKWHVMAHELWVDPDVSLKNRLLAATQARVLRWLLSYLNPSLVHTSNSYYTHLFASIGKQASILPLFSSIPLQPQLAAKPSSLIDLTFVFFGSIHPEWDPQSILEPLERAARNGALSSISFISIGGAGEHGKALWKKLARTTPPWMQFSQLGLLPSSEISILLQQADFGITTTPSHLLGKSASVAAMLAHGLSVIVPRLEKTCGTWHQELLADDRFLLLDSSLGERLSQRRRQADLTNGAEHKLSATTEQFLQALLGSPVTSAT